jgi:hypothetical protein
VRVCGSGPAYVVFDVLCVCVAAGLALTYALPFAQAVVFSIRMHAEMEMALNAVERVHEYTVIEQEAPAVIEQHRPPPRWV